MQKLSILISTFNRHQLLREVFHALNNQTADGDLFEVIVCDSHSSDGTANLVVEFQSQAKYDLKHVHTINNLAAKRNIGIASSTHSLLVFLDDDCIPERKFVTRHIANYTNYKSESPRVFCGEVRYPLNFVTNSNYYRFRDSRHFGYGPSYNNPPEFLDYKTIVVMNMCFEKEPFLNLICTVDESFVGYGAEDQDLGWRLQKNGYKIIPTNARIYHYETTGSIRAYGSKIRRASRDGMKTLLRVNPEAAFGISELRKLDAEFPRRSAIDRIILFLVSLFISLRLYRLLEWLLDKVDRVNFLYFPLLYRFLMGVYYVQGASERNFALTAEEAERGWEGNET